MAYPNDERGAQQSRPTINSRPNTPRPAEGSNRPTYNSRPAGTTRPVNGAARPAANTRAPQRPAAPANGRPAGNARPPQRPQPKKRSVQPRFFIFLAILLVLVIAAVFAVVKLTGGKPSNDPQTTPPAVTGTDTPGAEATEQPIGALSSEDYQSILAQLESEEGAAALDESQQVKVADLSINEELPSEWMNVLLLGTDERDLAADGRTDSMIICSINTVTGEVKLSSIMRDLAVNYGDLGYSEIGTARINAANFFGGPEMAMKTVNELFGLNIQYYALVNFFGFQDAVNALGGITLDITEAEMNKINEAQKQVAGIAKGAGIDIMQWDNEDLTVYGDDVRLNGQQALGYARIRKLDSDFGRAERQRKVLMAMLDEVKGKSPIELAQLGAAMMPYMSTNMDLNAILNVAMVVLQSDMNIDSMRLPVNGSYTQESRNEQDMLWDCDFVQNQQELYNFIYNQ